jgi:hypothetical protein
MTGNPGIRVSKEAKGTIAKQAASWAGNEVPAVLALGGVGCMRTATGRPGQGRAKNWCARGNGSTPT